MKSRFAVLCMLMGGLTIQSATVHANARDLLDHMDRQRQERREQRLSGPEGAATFEDERRQARGERRAARNSREPGDPAESPETRRQERRGDESRNAERRDFNRDSLRDRDSFRGIGPGEAARRAQQRNGGGRVLGVNPIDDGYSVRLLKQGEVRTLLVPQGE